MALDLSSLGSFDDKPQQKNGEPLQINIKDIEEDANQPRTIFEPKEIEKLAQSIKEHGLLTPISIKKHPIKKDKWLINNGARRFKAYQLLALTTIKAFIMDNHDDYAQIADNLIRENFKPLELAEFIQKKINLDEKKKDIAQKMGITPSMVTTYLAMLDMPECVKYIYDQGQNSPKLIYDLIKGYEKYPEQIEDWITSINNIEDVTVKSVRDFLYTLKSSSSCISEDVLDTEQEEIIENEEREKQEISKKIVKLKPIILIEFNQENYILVNKKTDTPDTIFIKQFTDGKEIEVKASKCKLIGTSEI